MKKILIIGAGSWGTALANTLAYNNKNVFLWTEKQNVSDQINKTKTNKKYFKKILLHKNITSISGKIDPKLYSVIFYVLPAKAFDQFLKNYLINNLVNNFIICSKGLGEKGEFVSDLAKEKLIIKHLFILSGPSFADEVILNKPTALSLAGKGQHEKIGKLFQNSNLRLYYSSHIKTLEFLGILKNIYALGAGIIDALNLGENAKASYLTRCLYEIKSTLKLKKLDQQQLFSLGGVGDIFLTSNSSKSRNYTFGYKLIKNKTKNSEKVTIEGLNSIFVINKNKDIDLNQLPILKTIFNIIKGKNPQTEIEKLLKRKFKFE
jgi:glycerol-3-phosphate dehydrogenase (NAD(P)+)